MSGRKAIYAGGSVPWHIEGMSADDSAPLITFVQEFSVKPQFTYRHKWLPGDIVVWDNRSAMHKATAYGRHYRRLMNRTTFAGPDHAASSVSAEAMS